MNLNGWPMSMRPSVDENKRIESMLMVIEHELQEILETLESGQAGNAAIALEKYLESLFRVRKSLTEGCYGSQM